MIVSLPDAIAAAIRTDRQLPADFAAICDLGGRLAGTPSERGALELVAGLGEAATGRHVERVATPYDGWTAHSTSLHLLGRDREVPLPCHPLVRTVATPPEGIVAEVVPVGRGTEAEFAAAASALRGRIALVRHEYMFASAHIHRRLKYGWAREAGAAGFLIAGPLPTRTVAGSSGRGREDGIPALGISPEAASRLATGTPRARARIAISASEHPATTDALLFDLPGAEAEWVVLSAHLDGHDLAESAIDNATGVAAALAVARALAPYAASFRRGLRLAFFSAEEWALTGSRFYLERLPEADKQAICLNVNLDSVAGAADLTALCSGYAKLVRFVREATRSVSVPVGTYLPPMKNSDHANFAACGIPALRLVAGFDSPGSELRHVLTPADTRDKVEPEDLHRSALAACAMTWTALTGRSRWR